MSGRMTSPPSVFVDDGSSDKLLSHLIGWGRCQLEDFKLCFWSPQLLPERPVDPLGKLESHQAHSPARSVEGTLIRKADMGRDPPHLSAHEADFAIRANESRDEW